MDTRKNEVTAIAAKLRKVAVEMEEMAERNGDLDFPAFDITLGELRADRICP
jgi:hypothetical protein